MPNRTDSPACGASQPVDQRHDLAPHERPRHGLRTGRQPQQHGEEPPHDLVEGRRPRRQLVLLGRQWPRVVLACRRRQTDSERGGGRALRSGRQNGEVDTRGGWSWQLDRRRGGHQGQVELAARQTSRHDWLLPHMESSCSTDEWPPGPAPPSLLGTKCPILHAKCPILQ
jgi:hypothetical protein